MIDARVGALSDASALGSAAGQRGALASGAISGLLGGAAMAIFLVFAASAAGVPAFHPLKVIGGTLVGTEALGAGSALYGLALHALTSIGLGLVFTAMFPRDLPPLCAVAVGLGYAMFAAGIMASLVVPFVNPQFRSAVQPMGGAWVLAHGLFGATLGLSHALQRRPSREVAAQS